MNEVQFDLIYSLAKKNVHLKLMNKFFLNVDFKSTLMYTTDDLVTIIGPLNITRHPEYFDGEYWRGGIRIRKFKDDAALQIYLKFVELFDLIDSVLKLSDPIATIFGSRLIEYLETRK